MNLCRRSECLTLLHGVVTWTVEHSNVRATVYSSERKSVFLLRFERRLYEYNLTSETYSTVVSLVHFRGSVKDFFFWPLIMKIGLIDKRKNTGVLDPLG